MLTWTGWKNYFGSDPNVVGKTVRINKQPYTIVGVTPEGFYGTEKFLQPDIFVPMANEASLGGGDWLESRREHNVWSVVRIKDGVTMPQVQAELNTIAAPIALGAQAKQILAAALGRMLILLASGAAAGMLLGVAASRVLSAIVYQASAQDPFVLAAVAFTVLLTGLHSVAGPP